MQSDSCTDLASQIICIVPMYNESEVIFDVVQGLKNTIPNVLCIDDGSTDNSAEIASQAGAIVVQHAVNIGQGAALATGFMWATKQRKFAYVVTFDADGQHRPSDALALVAKLKDDELDVVFASRFLNQNSCEIPVVKRILLKSVTFLTKILTDVKLSDAHNGLRALTIDALPKISLTQNGMAHASQFVSLVLRSGLRYSEMPVTVLYTPYSRSKGQSVLNSINILLDLIWG